MVNTWFIQNAKMFVCNLFMKLKLESISFSGDIKNLPGNVNQALLQKTFNKLYSESTDEAWAAMENILLSKPDKLPLAVKEVSLEKAISRNISVPFLHKLIENKANVNEVTTQVGYPPSNPLKRALNLNLLDHSALLISQGAISVESKAKKNQPPIIVATLIVLRKEGIRILKQNFII